ncbi:MAG: hypothetical protein C0462_13065 [Alcanivorax sp.]|nr:hypothetical protein [Alcanivorax sp.]
MSKKTQTLAAAFGAALIAGGMSLPAQAVENPFSATDLDAGYQLAGHHDKDAEGKCGEGKCGEGKCGEGKCGEGKCGSA